MNVYFESELSDFRSDGLDGLEDWLEEVANSENKMLGEIVYRFVSEKRILEINTKFLSHNYVTDIITFDESYMSLLAGEVFICIEEVRRNCREFGSSNFGDELKRVIVHGLLHLIGYADGTNEEKEVMRSKEDYYLKMLKIS